MPSRRTNWIVTTILLLATDPFSISTIDGFIIGNTSSRRKTPMSTHHTQRQFTFLSPPYKTQRIGMGLTGGEEEESEDPEVDAARIRFEALISSSVPATRTSGEGYSYTRKSRLNTDRSARTISSMLARSPFPPLTAIMRERFMKEIEILSALEESEEAVDELWTLWFTERGPTAASLLFKAEELVSQGESQWNAAETLLWSIIFEYGVYWAEPINRLATLKFLQGNLEESKELCEIVLKLKPWHFGALSGIVMVSAGLQDVNSARMWADRRLPPLVPKYTSSGRRKAWIENACKDARKRLFMAEKDRSRHNLGEEEIKFRMMRQELQQKDVDCKDDGSRFNETSEDVWQ